MNHEVNIYENRLEIVYHLMINQEDTEQLSKRVVEIVMKSDKKLNIILNIKDGYIGNISVFTEAARILKPHLNKFHKCYIYGASGIKSTFARMLLKAVGMNESKVLFVDSLEKARMQIDSEWNDYYSKK